MIRFYIVLIFAMLLLQASCKKGPTGPEFNDPRQYKWSSDTLHISPNQILMDAVWGISANNLHAVGHSSGSAGTMWRFDGNRWTNVKLGAFEGGTIETFSSTYVLEDIHGLSSNNIFAVGHRRFGTAVDSSFIIQYDGTQWREHIHHRENFLISVWVNAPNDVWACGYDGTLLHYDGIQWNKDSVVAAIPASSTLQLTSIARIPSGEMFMLGAAYEAIPPQMLLRWTYYFFRREGDTWTLHDTFVRYDGEREGKWGGYRLTVLPSGALYSVGSYGVFRWNGAQWVNRYSNSKNTAAVFGTNDNNLFVAGSFGLLSHYNGSDWFEYPELENQNTHNTGVWANNTQVFVFGWVDSEKTVVLTGK